MAEREIDLLSGGRQVTPSAQIPAHGIEVNSPFAVEQADTSPARKSLIDATRPQTPPSTFVQARSRDAQMGQSPSKAALASPSGRSKVTYSSGLRTFLESKPTLATEDAVPATSEPVATVREDDIVQEKQTQRESYSDLRKRWVIEEAAGSASSPIASTLVSEAAWLCVSLCSNLNESRFLYFYPGF